MLKAGTSRVNITPPMGISHAGWGAQTHQVAEGVDMPLYISALAVTQTGKEHPENHIIILDIDILDSNGIHWKAYEQSMMFQWNPLGN